MDKSTVSFFWLTVYVPVFLCLFVFLCFTDSLYGCVFYNDILLIYSAV